MASIDELRKQQMMEKAGVKPPVPGLVQQATGTRIEPYVNWRSPNPPPAPEIKALGYNPATVTRTGRELAVVNQPNFVMGQTPQSLAAKAAQQAAEKAQFAGYTPPKVDPKTGLYTDPKVVPSGAPVQPNMPSPGRAANMLSKVGSSNIPRAISGLGTAVGVGMEGAKVYETAKAPNSTKMDVAEQAAESTGRLAGGYVGAKAGAALGTLGGPLAPVTVPLGAIAGGLVGYSGAGKLASLGREMAGVDGREAVDRVAPVNQQTAQRDLSSLPQASYSNEGRNFTNPIVATATTQAKPQAMPQPEAPAAEAPQARQVAPGIYRSGNSYGDSAEAAISGPRGSGQPSARNMAAADALASRYAGPGMTAQAAQPAQGPSAYIPKDTGGYGLLDKGYRDRRSAMMDAQQMKPGARTALAALLKEQSAQGDREAQAEQNAADRGFRQGENALDRGLKSQELMARMDDSAATRQLRAQELQDNMATNAVKRDAAGVEVTSAKQMADLRSQYLNAKTDAERNDAARKLQALSGKADTSLKDNFMVVGGGQEWDANAMAMRNVPQQLIDLRTGRPVTGGQQAPAQGPVKIANDAEFDALPKGAIYIGPDGKKYQKP